MQPTCLRGSTTRVFATVFSLAIVCSLFCSTLALAQDSPGRFEAGGSFNALHFHRAGFGPAVEGDINFGRHFALDGSFSWFPKNTIGKNAMTGLFGVKGGMRTQRFGLFAKVRPGFLTFDNALREETILVTPGPLGFPIVSISSLRFGRLTQPALDLGGVVEYYPARHWAFRWDMGDTLIFQEKGPTFNFIGVGTPVGQPFTQRNFGSNHFQFSTGIHYRF
ncbi:MAG TPA: hypothetical protein VH724_07695 [Candidatus Angelobacter sp.]|nr:hypothetical protein [Candidatus Angelobacter sp.]